MFKQIVIDICKELGIKYTLLSNNWVFKLEYNNIIKYITGYKFDLNDHSIGIILDDKYATYELLNSFSIPIISHNIIYSQKNNHNYAIDYKSIKYAKDVFNKYNKNIVLKTNNGSGGINVFHITSFIDFKRKLKKLFKKYLSLSICPYFNIEQEFRTIVLNNKIMLMYGKERPIVVGDGKKSVKELLLNFNYEYFKKKNIIKYIPKENEKFVYSWKFNLAKGSKVNENIDKDTKDRLLKIVNMIINNIDIKFASIDIIKTIDNNYYVLEINSGVVIKKYIDQVEDGYNKAYTIYKSAIIEMFRN